MTVRRRNRARGLVTRRALSIGSWLLIFAWLAIAPRVARATESDPASLERARAFVSAGQTRAAIALLKPVVEQNPEDELLVLALADAYRRDKNPLWASRILTEHAERYPPACRARASLAELHLESASPELAEQVLDEVPCNSVGPLRVRFALIRARMAQAAGDSIAAERHLAEAQGIDERYRSDDAALEALRAKSDPGRLPLLSWTLDAAGGYTSNGLMGSPLDPAERSGNLNSAVGVLDIRTRLLVPASRFIRPSVEIQMRAFQLFASAVSELSYRQPAIRPGLLLGNTWPRLLISYAYDAIHLNAGDRYSPGPLWFSEGHRAEWELEATPDLITFGGVGLREFRERGRSRLEADQGLAMGFQLARLTRLLGGITARWYNAENPAYNLAGGGVLLRLQRGLPERFELRAGAAASRDLYLSSEGYFDKTGRQERRDTLLRGNVGFWSPPLSGARLGLDYELNHRMSTVDAYAFEDHRVTLHAVWAFDLDRLTKSIVREPWLLSATDESRTLGQDDARIRDLIRQDEAIKRGSSCLK